MVKVKGVNIFPSQIEEFLKNVDGASSEYQFVIDHLEGKDICTLYVEAEEGVNKYELEHRIVEGFKGKIGITVNAKPVAIGDLPRSEKEIHKSLRQQILRYTFQHEKCRRSPCGIFLDDTARIEIISSLSRRCCRRCSHCRSRRRER